MQKPSLLKQTHDAVTLDCRTHRLLITKHDLADGTYVIKVRRLDSHCKLVYRVGIRYGPDAIMRLVVNSIMSGVTSESFRPLVYAIGGTIPGVSVKMPTPPSLIVH